jgi:galactokinase
VAVPSAYLTEKFPERFPSSGKPTLFRAPGRVNLIGEHTDYNLGFVMPIAIELACYAAIAPGSSPGYLRVYSEDILQGHEWLVDHLADATPRGEWTDYVLGVIQQLTIRGVKPEQKDLLIHSTVPLGGGLSSSAALEVASALALSNGAVKDKLELVRLCHRAENDFIGLPSGIMDQFVSVFAKANRAIKLDCRSLQFEEVPLPDNVLIFAVNTMVKHELGASAYRQRVAECTEAVQAIKRKHAQVASLRDAVLEMIDDSIPEPARKRARHVLTENDRVHQFADAARAGDLKKMGELFVASHRSLQYDYEVSSPELDFLVDVALGLPGVFGARMTGGGFGGCTVNLVDPASAGEFQAKISAAYKEKFNKEPQIYGCRPSAGAGPIIS